MDDSSSTDFADVARSCSKWYQRDPSFDASFCERGNAASACDVLYAKSETE